MIILQKRVAALSQASLERFVLRARRAAGLRGSANVLVTSSSVIRALNRQFRGRNKATDVLSFPSGMHAIQSRKHKRTSAGDIAISADIAAQNAVRFGHSPVQEVKILALHGLLHLAGFDHERDNGRMARKEAELRQTLNLPASLIDRATTDRASSPQRKPAKRNVVRKRAPSVRRTA